MAAVVLTDLDELVVDEAALLEFLRDAETGAWFAFEPNGDGTWTIWTALARGEWPPKIGE